MHRVQVYTTPSCSYCVRAKRLLEARVPYRADEFGLTSATLEAAQEAEAEAIATQDSLRHSTREASMALLRRLQMGLALRLAEFGGPTDFAGQISQAAAHLQSASKEYRAKVELREGLAVLDRLITLRQREGESPALSRALAAQLETINHLRPQPDYPPTEKHAHPALHLQLSRKSRHESPAELEALRQQTQLWFADYHANLNVLIESSLAGESASA